MSIFHLFKSLCWRTNFLWRLSSFILNNSSCKISWRWITLVDLFLILNDWVVILNLSFIGTSVWTLFGRWDSSYCLILTHINVSRSTSYKIIVSTSIWNRRNHIHINTHFSFFLRRRSKVMKRSICWEWRSISFWWNESCSSLSMFFFSEISNEISLVWRLT